MGQHPKYAEKYNEQRKKVDGLRDQSRQLKDQVSSGGKMMQPKLFAGNDKMLRLGKASDKQMQSRYDEARVLMAAKGMVPFYALQHTNLIARALLPKSHQIIKNKSPKTISLHTKKMANDLRRDILSIKLSIKESLTSIAFTTDMWKSKNNFSFVGLTSHVITENMDLLKLVPYVEYFGPKRHTADNILMSINTLMEEMGLDSPEIRRYLIMDNASNNKKAMRVSSEYVPLWCVIHTLQLCITDSLKVKIGMISVTRVLVKCKEISKLVRRSEANRDDLRRACQATRPPTDFILPHKPGDTRWNSKNENLRSVLRLRSALQFLAYDDKTSETWGLDVPTASEFKVAEAVHKCLEPFKIATKLLESDQSPTMHLVVRELWNIKSALQIISRTSDHCRMFARHLMRQLEKRFKDSGTYYH